MIYILLALTVLCSSIMDAIMSNNAFSKYGLWASQDGWKLKYVFTEWLNKFLPLWLSKFIAQDVLVVFTDLWHTAKTVMIASFLICIFGFTFQAFVAYLVWGFTFNIVYTILR